MLIWAMPPVDVEAQWSRFQERRRVSSEQQAQQRPRAGGGRDDTEERGKEG